MPLDKSLKNLIDKNLNTVLGVYEDLKGSKESLQKFTSQFLDVTNDIDFLYGFIEGELSGSAFSTARTILQRQLTPDEQQDLIDLIKSKRQMVGDLITRVKSV
jgi:hypothetical protein